MNDCSPHGVDFDNAIDNADHMLCNNMRALSALSSFQQVLIILQGKTVRFRMCRNDSVTYYTVLSTLDCILSVDPAHK